MRRFAWLLMLLTVAPAAAEPFAPKLLKEFGTSRFRYPGSVAGSVVSPDGNYIAVRGSADVWVYEFATGRNVWRSRFKDRNFDDFRLNSLPVFDSANNLLTIEFNADIWPRIATYCISSGKLLRTVRIKLSRIHGAIFSPDATILAIRRAKDVIFHDAQTGAELYRLLMPSDSDTQFKALRFSPDSRRVAVSSHDDRVRVYDRATGAELANFMLSKTVRGLAFSLDRERLSIHMVPSTVESFDFVSGARTKWKLDFECTQVLGLRGDRIACFDESSGNYRIVDAGTGKVLKTLNGPRGFSLSVMNDGRTVIVPEYLWRFALWDLETGRKLPQSATDVDLATEIRFGDSDRLFVKNWDHISDSWMRYDWRTGIGRPLANSAPNHAEDLSPDGKLLIVPTDDSVTLNDASSGKTLHKMKYPARTRYPTYRFLNGGNSVGIVDQFEVVIWNYKDGCSSRLVFPIDAPQVRGTVSPSGRWFASQLANVESQRVDDTQLQIRELPSGRIASILRHNATVLDFRSFTSDESRLFYSVQNPNRNDIETIHVVDPVTGRHLRQLDLQCLFPHSLTPDGRALLAFTSDPSVAKINELQIIEIATGLVRFELQSADIWNIQNAGCAPDLRRVAVGTSDGLVRVWDTAPDDGAMPPDALAWDDLRDADAAKGDAAIRRFAKHPAVGLPLLKAKLPPEPVVDPAAVAGWLRDLGAPAFRTRDDATKNLASSMSAARPAMEKTLAATPSPEVRERLTTLLALPAKPLPDEIRAIRAAEIVERILADKRTASETRRVAIELLKGWAGGADGTTLTTEAKETLNRMKR